MLEPLRESLAGLRVSVLAKLQELVMPNDCFQIQEHGTRSDPFADNLLGFTVVITYCEMLFEITLRVFQVGLRFRRQHFIQS